MASSTQINLSWSASSDNVGVTGYRVERCQGAGCSNFVQVAAPGGTASTRVCSRRPVTAGLRILATRACRVATVASSTQINLSWSASTTWVSRAIALPGCRLFELVQVAAPGGTAHNDTAAAVDQLQLSGAGGGCGRESEWLLERAERNHAGGPGHAAADGADRALGDGGELDPDQPLVERVG